MGDGGSDMPTLATTLLTTQMSPTMAPSVVDNIETTEGENGGGKEDKKGNDAVLITFAVVTAVALILVGVVLYIRKRRKDDGHAYVAYDSAQNLLNNEIGSDAK